ncbi:mitochondrial ATP-independent inner membrane protease subunit 1a isoform X2 [Amaranthus tricolor]|uniref:mitochondrial ATP-independent inner membrane protease subunit 1a isoform X2 n=1 Tax=Amaranthus tricolor TaxID=29722 RepID=UPI0025901503|nr:mitochondrial ATP-independent inner membrane protease subunit 1a isoform X2 [Amaranthus tricolor]
MNLLTNTSSWSNPPTTKTISLNPLWLKNQRVAERMWASKLVQLKSIAKETVERTIIIARFLCLLHVTDTYLFSPNLVHGPSMLPTLNMRGDVLMVDRFSHRFGKVELGDVVLVTSPNNPKKVLTKRVLGLEGDAVSFNVHDGLKTLVDYRVEGRSTQKRKVFLGLPTAIC